MERNAHGTSAGTFKETRTVGGEQIYIGGTPAIVKLRANGLRLRVICQSCAYYRLEVFGGRPRRLCRKNLMDNGEQMRILYDGEKMCGHWRCPGWAPHPTYLRPIKGDGRVQSPEYVAWKREHWQLIAEPGLNGYVPARNRSLRAWLQARWQEYREKKRKENRPGAEY